MSCPACARYGRTLCLHRTPPARRAELRRHARMPRRNERRARRLFANTFGDKATWIRSLPCALIGARGHQGPIEAAHVRSRGAGGTAADLLPLCAHHHAEQHRLGVRTFEARLGCDLRDLAARYEREFREAA